MKYFHVAISEPAGTGLFAHPARIRHTIMVDYGDNLGLRFVGGEGRWLFSNGRGMVFTHALCEAVIVEEVPASQAMNRDWFTAA
jgi:hypothetical protein